MSIPRKQDTIESRKLFSDNDLIELSSLFIKLTGNKFSADKRSLLESRLIRRLYETKLDGSEYLNFLKRNLEEQEKFVSALTTHKTDWFREPGHFDFLINKMKEIPNSPSDQPKLVWSAACSSGEEIYSLCILLYKEGLTNFRVLGSDISLQCVEAGIRGIYSAAQIENQVPDTIIKKYFQPVIHDGKASYHVCEKFIQHLKWRQYNLLSGSLSGKVYFDFIFLRNVLIYFDQDTTKLVISNLLKYLKPGGFLFIGLSENLPFYQEFNLRRVGNSIYQYEK